MIELCAGRVGSDGPGDKHRDDNGSASLNRVTPCMEEALDILITSALISGLCLGSMYGLIALGFHVTYVVSNTVNFSQGSSVMLGAVLGYTFATRLGLPLAARVCRRAAAVRGLRLACGAHPGAAVRGAGLQCLADGDGGGRHRARQRRAVPFGKEPRSFPPLLSTTPIKLFGAGVFPLAAGHPGGGLGVAAALALLLRRTRHGKALLAVVQNPDAARLMGINVKAAIAASFAALDGTRGPRRAADRAAVQRALRHGHSVRHQGVRGGHPGRHRLGARRDAGRADLRA